MDVNPTLCDTLRRCPHCHRAANPDERGRCPRCLTRSTPEEWESHTAEAPVQEKEIEKGLCSECGDPLIVMLPGRVNPLDPLGILAGLSLLYAARLSSTDGNLAFYVVALALFGVLYVILGGHRLRHAMILSCRRCGTARICGLPRKNRLRAFRRGRALVIGGRRWLLPAFYFVASSSLYAHVFAGGAPRSLSLLVFPLSITILALCGLRAIYLPAPQRWWHRFLLR